MRIPKTSLLVVIKGPVATAGSIPFLSKKIGIKVPIIAAFTITVIRAIPMVTETK